MPQLLIVASHTGEVTNVIVCDNEHYAAELARYFTLYTNTLSKYVPYTNETEAIYLPYINFSNSRPAYQD